jgi:hypothetical protein
MSGPEGSSIKRKTGCAAGQPETWFPRKIEEPLISSGETSPARIAAVIY